jgi:hypothetical protein
LVFIAGLPGQRTCGYTVRHTSVYFFFPFGFDLLVLR